MVDLCSIPFDASRQAGSFVFGTFSVARMRNVARRRAGRDLDVSRNSTEKAK